MNRFFNKLKNNELTMFKDIAGPYTVDSIKQQLIKNVQEIGEQIAEEMLDKMEIRSVFEEQIGKEKYLMTVEIDFSKKGKNE